MAGPSSEANTNIPSSPVGNNPADIISQIAGIGRSPQEMQHLAAEAATPIAGGHSSNIPLTLQPQLKEWSNSGYIPRDPNATGAGSERGRGIGNAAIGVINMLGKHGTDVENKRKLQLATDTQTLLTSQSSIDQAKQILQNDPDNQSAKDAIVHNTQIMNGILSDEKTRKSIAKGFDISFSDPEANKTPDHEAVAMGKQMAQKTASYAEQFSKGVPTTVSANTVAQAKYAQAIEEQKMHQETAKSLLGYLATAQRIKGQFDVAQLKELGANAREEARLQTQWQMLGSKIKAAQTLQKSKYSDAFALIEARGREARKTAESIWDYKTTDKTQLAQRARETDIKYQDAIDKATNTQRQAELDLNAARASKADPSMLKDYETMINTAKESVLNLTAQRDAFKKSNQALGILGAEDGNKSGNNFNPNNINSYNTDDPSKLLNDLNDTESWEDF